MSEIAVSVVVPVYNTERYLERCLESLVNQTLQNIEIIVVNDGSTDNAQKIIDYYAQRYHEKIIPVIQENQGLGPARNHGISIARGEYIGFVDSDDWVALDMYQKMYKLTQLENSDIAICDLTYNIEDPQDTWSSSGYNGVRPKPYTISDFMLGSLNPALACNKLFARRLFQIATFPNIWFEDAGTIPILISHAKHVCYCPEHLFFYFLRKDSITAQESDPRNLGIIQAWDRCIKQVNERYKWEVAYAVYHSIMSFIDFRPTFREEFLGFYNENLWFFESNRFVKEAIQLKDIIKRHEELIETHECTVKQLDNTRVDLHDLAVMQNHTKDELERTVINLERAQLDHDNKVSELVEISEDYENVSTQLNDSKIELSNTTKELFSSQEYLEKTRDLLVEVTTQLDEARKDFQKLEKLYEGIQSSTFWKLTKPARYIVDVVKRLFRGLNRDT